MLYYTHKAKRQLEHFLRVELYEKIDKFFKMDPKAFIYKDMEELEKSCNEILDNSEVDVVHSPNPMHPPQKVQRLEVTYDTNDMGFVVPESCNFKLYF